MIPSTWTAVVTASLTAVEQQADSAGWGALPVLYALTAPSDHRPADVVRVRIDESYWREYQSAVDPGIVPIWVLLAVIIDRFLLGDDWLPDELASPPRPLIGFAVLHETRDTSALDDAPGATPLWVRALIGYDRHGCVYEVRRVHGAAAPTVTVLTGPAPDQLPLLITECLRPLATALCAAAGGDHDRPDASWTAQADTSPS